MPTPPPPSAADLRAQPDLFGAVLASVSRSFYLTIRALPPALRRPVGLAYLLARSSDTIADSAGTDAAMRIVALRELGTAIQGGGPTPDLTHLGAGVSDPAEQALLGRVGTLVALLHATEPEDRDSIVRVLEEILRGQALDVGRFPKAGDGEVRALSTAGELEDYTYSVAGCVGDFWTRICMRHLRDYSRKDAGEMVRLGVAFGKGLQLVNILRDLPADLANGRCYLPADEFAALGVETADLGTLLKERPELARPVFLRWLARARNHLDSAFCYLEAVRPWRLRLACFLPWALGVKTLGLLEQSPSLETSERVKVPRAEVRRMLWQGVLAAPSNRALRRIARRLVL